MKTKQILLLGVLGIILSSAQGFAANSDDVDPFLYLENSTNPQTVSWVANQNQLTLNRFHADSHYLSIKQQISTIALATDRLSYPTYMGGYVYNYWQDQVSVRGLWRRTTVAEYAKGNPTWETVLDLDQLAKNENQNWVWGAAACYAPEYRLCMISLSVGGSDSSTYREFDTKSKTFVKNGFVLPTAKNSVSWLDADHLLIGTDFGGKDDMTSSGYPRMSKVWARGTQLEEAKFLYAGSDADVSVESVVFKRALGSLVLFEEDTSFYTANFYLPNGDVKDTRGALSYGKLPLPNDVSIDGSLGEELLLQLRSDWKIDSHTFTAGSLVSVGMDDLKSPHPVLIYAPDAQSSIQTVAPTRGALYVSTLDNVNGRLLKFTRLPLRWKQESISFPDLGAIDLQGYDQSREGIYVAYESFLIPAAIYSVGIDGRSSNPRKLYQSPDRFDPSPYEVEQFESTSKDGTKIPYFIVHAKNIALDGKNPTLLYGYGGFEISETPYYLSTTGKVWMEAGGVYVLANIRGGGEFGPKWHEAAILQNKQKSYDDFISVAEDLIARKITSPAHLGIWGGSNGGLLVGATFVERPDLFNAVICQVPLLDMVRYPFIGAGASWEGEYGDPSDPQMLEAILGYSPYQNVKPGVRYPEVYFETSFDDDRVTPAHARKMAAKMESMGYPVLFVQTAEGGHSSSANIEDSIESTALEFVYLFEKLL